MGTTSPLNNLDVFSSSSTTVSFSSTSGASRILLGNQDTGGSNNPALIQGINGELYLEEVIIGEEEEIMIFLCLFKMMVTLVLEQTLQIY